LKNQFGNRFGSDKIVILPNTKPVIKADLKPDYCYLQIISVDVYLVAEELQKRDTLFEQNFNINKFIFETPFTKTGKVHGGMNEQFKRKTILTVEAMFPYIKKRLRVVEKVEIELTPIETAIELIERKTVSLKTELHTANINVKTLQMALQGSLLAQVNAGPLEICRTFLGDNMTMYQKEHVDKLIASMNNFVITLHEALPINNRYITPNQKPFQEELQNAYYILVKEVRNFMTLDMGDAEDELGTVEESDEIE